MYVRALRDGDLSQRSSAFTPAIVVLICVVVSLAACAKQTDGGFPEFDTPELKLGRAIWLENCQACHGTGLAGAPHIGDRIAWKPRIGQGLPILFEHAMKGFAGPTGTEMPARGGRPELDDMAVQLAVRYMVKASE